MSTQDALVIELRRKKAELLAEIHAAIQQAAALTEQAKEKTLTLQHVQALLSDTGDEPDDAPRMIHSLTDPSWGDLSIPQAVFRLLSEMPKPMHANDIRDELERRGIVTGKDQVVTALVRGAKRDRFRKTAPNTYTAVFPPVLTREEHATLFDLVKEE